MIIAISGFKGSGKDSCANYLVEKYNFQKISFAGPLKDIVSENFGIPRNWLDDSNYKELPLGQYPVPATDEFTKNVSRFMIREFRTSDGFYPEVADIRVEKGFLQTFINGWEDLYHTPRSLAILIGSSMRCANPNFWVGQAIKQMMKEDSVYTSNFVISDFRYKNEGNQLKNAFGKNLIMIRVNRFDSSPSNDPSELDLVDYEHDFVINNKGTKEEMFVQLENILNKYNKKGP